MPRSDLLDIVNHHSGVLLQKVLQISKFPRSSMVISGFHESLGRDPISFHSHHEYCGTTPGLRSTMGTGEAILAWPKSDLVPRKEMKSGD